MSQWHNDTMYHLIEQIMTIVIKNNVRAIIFKG